MIGSFHFKDYGRAARGFALVVTISLMILLTLIAVGLLSLSSVALRSSSQANAQAEAQANARLALMIALGELQKEMGPDMRVSAESALFDQNKDTDVIEGVAQSHWLASYDAWGGWLNSSYTPPGKPSTSIGDTYNPGRTYYNDSGGEKGMFRRWLLSMPDGSQTNINAPMSSTGWNNSNSVVLVGRGSLGDSAVGTHLETRAYLTNVVKNNITTGKNAWWIGPENHKARIDKAKRPRNLAANEWETSQGDTAEVGVGALEGFETLDGNQAVGDKLITTNALRNVPIDTDPAVNKAKVEEHFFDLTAQSRGVLASVRTGRLKKDLSLLFEKDKADLPDGSLPDDPVNYRFNSGDVREPSIRPMSPEIIKKPALVDTNGNATRYFASWTRMRHFYRMYRQDSDAEARTYANVETVNTKAT